MTVKSIAFSALLVAVTFAFLPNSQAAQLPEMQVGTMVTKVPAAPLDASEQPTTVDDDSDATDDAAADSAN